jgi:DNA-binding transcriptional LysR family regulator
VEVVVNKTNDLINSVLSQNLDFAMVNKAFVNNELDYIHLYDEQMVVVVKKGNPVCKYAKSVPGSTMRGIDMKHLINEPFIAFQNGHWQRKMLEYLCHKQNATPNIFCETNSPMSAVAHVKAGLGITTLVKSITRFYRGEDEVEFLSVLNPYPPVEYVIATLKNKTLTDTTKIAISVVQELISIFNAD